MYTFYHFHFIQVQEYKKHKKKIHVVSIEPYILQNSITYCIFVSIFPLETRENYNTIMCRICALKTYTPWWYRYVFSFFFFHLLLFETIFVFGVNYWENKRSTHRWFSFFSVFCCLFYLDAAVGFVVTDF